MIVLTTSQTISLCVCLGVLIICLLWIYEEFTASQKYEEPVKGRIFRCPKCHTSFKKSHAHTARCPNCNNMCYLKMESPKDKRPMPRKKG